MARYTHQLNTRKSPIVIWTPRFILLFVLTAITGLSAASILTEAWMNNHYHSSLILSGYVLVILITFIILTRFTHSMWMRLGTLFGYLWAIFSLVTFFLPTTGLISLIRVQLLAAASSTLLGFYVCISTHRTPHRRWDTFLFWLAPPLGACILIIYVLFHPVSGEHLRGLVETATTILLVFGSGIWWLRPSCWRTQACSTFLFGLAPPIMIFVNYWAGDALGTRLFLSQLALLCILLGLLRVIQTERTERIERTAHTTSSASTALAEEEKSEFVYMSAPLARQAPHDKQDENCTNGVVEQVEQHARPE